MVRVLLNTNERTTLTSNLALRVVVATNLVAYFVCVRKSKSLCILRTENTWLFLFYVLRTEWVLANAYGCLLNSVVGFVGIELSVFRSNWFLLALNSVIFVCRPDCNVTKITFWMHIPCSWTILNTVKFTKAYHCAGLRRRSVYNLATILFNCDCWLQKVLFAC
jgi:hypothetical protein